MYTAEQIERVMRDKGYAVFIDESKPYNLNLFGIRTDDDDANRFNDVLGCFYRYQGRWVLLSWPGTTDPGLYYREQPMNVKGTAILVPGQYRGAFKIGEHKGYEALVQRRPLPVYRDSNRDEILDTDPSSIDEGMHGINWHRANRARYSTRVDRWSAGCQVNADPIHHDLLMALVQASEPNWGNAFTYTLVTTKDFG